MTITPDHFQQIRRAFLSVAAEIPAHRERLKADPRVKDLDKRLRWDVLYATLGAAWTCREIYPYANDTHLDTALRRVMTDLDNI